MLSRTDYLNNSLTENFTYDNLNRLTSSQVVGSTALTMDYQSNGNIKTKSDISTQDYQYDAYKIHAAKEIANPSAVIPSATQTISYNSSQQTGKFQTRLQDIATIAGGTLSGGIASEIAGGEFMDGALQGAITSGLNHLLHRAQLDERKKKILDQKSKHKYKKVLQKGDVDCLMACGAMMLGLPSSDAFKALYLNSGGRFTSGGAIIEDLASYLLGENLTQRTAERLDYYIPERLAKGDHVLYTIPYKSNTHTVIITRIRGYSDGTYRLNIINLLSGRKIMLYRNADSSYDFFHTYANFK